MREHAAAVRTRVTPFPARAYNARPGDACQMKTATDVRGYTGAEPDPGARTAVQFGRKRAAVIGPGSPRAGPGRTFRALDETDRASETFPSRSPYSVPAAQGRVRVGLEPVRGPGRGPSRAIIFSI